MGDQEPDGRLSPEEYRLAEGITEETEKLRVYGLSPSAEEVIEDLEHLSEKQLSGARMINEKSATPEDVDDEELALSLEKLSGKMHEASELTNTIADYYRESKPSNENAQEKLNRLVGIVTKISQATNEILDPEIEDIKTPDDSNRLIKIVELEKTFVQGVFQEMKNVFKK